MASTIDVAASEGGRYKNEKTQEGGARLLRVDFAVEDHGFGDAAG